MKNPPSMNKYELNIEQLRSSFKEQKIKYVKYIKGFENDVDKAFNIAVEQLKEIDPSEITISITDSKSLFFIIKNFGGYDNIHYEVFFGDSNINAAFSLYRIKKLIAQYMGDIDMVYSQLYKKIKLCTN